MNDNTPITRAVLDASLEKFSQTITQQLNEITQQLKEYIDERTHDAETRLLRAFNDYNNSAGTRFRKLEADTSNIDVSTTQRLGEIERQLTDFKLRLIALEGQGGSK